MDTGFRTRSCARKKHDPRARLRHGRHTAHRAQHRALRRTFSRAHFHARRTRQGGEPRQHGRDLCQAFCRQGSLLQGAGHRFPQRRVLARHGRGQSGLGPSHHEADRRRAQTAAGDHARRLRGPNRRVAHRRRPKRAGHRDHFGIAANISVEPRNAIRPSAYTVARAFLIAPWKGSRYKVAGAQRLEWRDERPMSVTSGTKRKEGGIAETIRVIFHALVIALVIRTFLFQPFNIPSGSMKATLLVGDYLFVSKYTYGYSQFSLPLSPPLFSGRIPSAWKI